MLSKKAEYSLYALVNLARNFNGGPKLISKISQEEMIPKKFLENILYELKKVGIVNSKKGKGGGYYLFKKPDDVMLVDVIRHFDGAIALLPCVSDKYYRKCGHNKEENICGIRSILRKVRDDTVKTLEQTSLQEILNIESRLLKFI